MLNDAIEIKTPDRDSHFRLLPCKQCRGEDAVYVKYRKGSIEPWRVQCLSCGYVVDKGAVARHDAQVAWNGGRL